MLAKVLQFDQVYPVVVGEALGLYHALQWMQDMHFDNIDFELDSKITRDAFHSRTVDVTEFGNIIDACRYTFCTSFKTPGSSSLGDKRMRQLMLWLEKPHP